MIRSLARFLGGVLVALALTSCGSTTQQSAPRSTPPPPPPTEAVAPVLTFPDLAEEAEADEAAAAAAPSYAECEALVYESDLSNAELVPKLRGLGCDAQADGLLVEPVVEPAEEYVPTIRSTRL